MNKKIYIAGILALAVLIGGSYHLQSTQPSKIITVGVLVPLTGKSASVGERVKAGIEAGMQTLATRGDVPFRIVFEDDKGEATAAVSAAQKLLSSGSRILIGTVKSDAMLAVTPITEVQKVILLSPTAGAAAISEAGDYVFRLIELPNVHGEAGARVLNDKKVALFVAQAANAKSYGDAFRTAFATGHVVNETEYQQDNTDFRTEIARAKANGATAYYLAVATAKDAGVLTKQIRESGFTGTVMASVAADAKEFFDAAGTAAEGTIVSAPYFDPTKFSDGFTANGYDAVLLLASAIEECDEDTDCIRDHLYATKGYTGAGGTLSFDAKGDVVKPVLLKIAHNNKFEVWKN